MAGPTRSAAFDRRPHPPQRGTDGRRRTNPAARAHARVPTDLWDELDQFVDSEPASWAGRGRARSRTVAVGVSSQRRRSVWDELVPPEPPARRIDDGFGADEAGEAVAFSGASASQRRDTFTRRLNEELAKPVTDREQEGGAVSTASVAAHDSAEPDPAGSSDAVSGPRLQEPADALDWELDNAIGAIVSSGRRAAVRKTMSADPAMPASVATEDEGGLVSDAYDERLREQQGHREDERTEPSNTGSGTVASNPPSLATEPAEASKPRAPTRPLESARPLDTRRLKQVPTFRFDKRVEPEEAAEPARDVDDPLEHVFFGDARAAFDDVRSQPGRARRNAPNEDATDSFLDDDADERFEPFEAGGYGEDGLGDDEGELPPSLRHASRSERRRGPGLKVIAIASAVVGIAVVALAGVVGVTVFAGSDEGAGEPPIIRADARDVKVRATEVGADAQPEIGERVKLGASDTLVIPEQVSITRASTQEDGDGDEFAARRVSTVEVRPDGTTVPASEARQDDVGSGGPTNANADGAATESGEGTEPSANLGASSQDGTGDAVDDAQIYAALPSGDAGGSGDAEREGEPVVASTGSDADAAALAAEWADRPEWADEGVSGADRPAGTEAALPDRGTLTPGEPSEDGLEEATSSTNGAPGLPAEDAEPQEATAEVGAVRTPRPRPVPPGPSEQGAPASAPEQDATTSTPEEDGPATALQRTAYAAEATDQPVASTAPSDDPAGGSASGGAPWGVQLSSQRSLEDAQASWQNLQQRYPGLLAGTDAMIYPADVDGRGRFFRVRLAANTQGEASALCQRLKSAGADCFVGRN